MVNSWIIRFVFLISILNLISCSTSEIKPWEKGILALPAMEMGEPGISTSLQGRFYYSREASRGGSGSSVGGCGCN